MSGIQRTMYLYFPSVFLRPPLSKKPGISQCSGKYFKLANCAYPYRAGKYIMRVLSKVIDMGIGKY